MTNLALSWDILGNRQISSKLLVQSQCTLCRKTINLNYLLKKTCDHTFCTFCGSLSMERCYSCGSLGPPQLEINDNTSDSKLPD